MIEGLDCSNRQGPVAWDRVAAAGVAFAFVKASEGTTFRDSYLPGNLASADSHGIAPAAYHFALPSRNQPEAEAQWFLDCAGPYLRPGYPVALDLEDDPYGGSLPADCGAWAVAWMAAVWAALGCTPLLYTDLNLIHNYGLARAELADCGLWLAYPGSVEPATPQPWPFIACWQYSWQGSVPGISGAVDLDRFAGTVQQFRAYGLPQPADPCAGVTAQLQQVSGERDSLAATVAAVRAAVA